MKKYFNVSFEHSDNVYCTNIAIAENEADVAAHYAKYAWYKIKEAVDYEVESAKCKGMPIINCEHIEPEKPEETTEEKETKNMKYLNLEELKSGLELTDCTRAFNDYRGSTTYICDMISEIADNYTSIYYSDIIKFISENVKAVNDAIEEFGWDGCGGDLYKAGQMAEYSQLQKEMWENQLDGLKLCAYEYLQRDLDYVGIPEELNDLIEEWCEEADNDDRMCEIPEKIDSWIEENTSLPFC